jgi:DNA-binding SARP family transcriptional activator
MYRLLGPVEVHTQDGRVLTLPRRRERCLLAILLLEAGSLVRVDRLRHLLWDDDPPDRSHQAIRTPDPAPRESLLREALALWRGPALDKAASDRLWRRLCADLEEQRLQAVEACLAAGLELGRHRELLPELGRLAADHPLRERLVAGHRRAQGSGAVVGHRPLDGPR